MDISIVKALPDDVVKALCNTLIYSLWQGLVLAAVAGLVVVCTRRATSAMRYNLLVASLLLFACGTGYTFVSELHVAQISNATHQVVVNATNDGIQQINPVTLIYQHATFTENLISYFNTHANLIVLIWFLVVCARSVQLVTGLNSLYHLRRRSIFAVDKEWQSRVYELSARLGITRMVSIAESGIAKVPMVIGHLKPIILIPVGLITALSPAEVDAILVHELAHIRRRDYLVNLLQSLMEIVFFFNPAVLWISSLIKAERENCCDDIALAQTSNKANYIRALVSCQEYQLSAPAYAIAFSGKRNHLLGRVKRMVSNSNQSLNMMEKSLLAICLLTAALVTTAFSNADKIDKLINKTTKAVAHVTAAVKQEIIPDKPELPELKATIPALSVTEVKPIVMPAINDTTNIRVKIYSPDDMHGKIYIKRENHGLVSYIWTRDGKFYQFNIGNGEIRSVQIDGRTLTNEEVATAHPELDRMLAEQGQRLASESDRLNQQQMLANVSTASLGTLQPGTLGKLDKINSAITDALLREISAARIADSINRKNRLNTLPPLPTAVPTPPAYAPKAEAYAKSKAAYDNQKATNEAQKDKIIADMIADGIITKDHADLSFKISTTEFIVNYKKQPDNIYQKYRAKYVRVLKNANGEWSWMYNYDSAKDKTTESIHTKETN